MEKLHTLFAGVIALFLSLTGHVSTPPSVQAPGVKSVSIATATDVNEGVDPVSVSVTTSTKIINNVPASNVDNDCIVIKIKQIEGKTDEYSQCGNILGDYQYTKSGLFFIENGKWHNEYSGLFTTPLNAKMSNSSITKLKNDCNSVKINYKDGSVAESVYCGALPDNYFVIGKKLYYGGMPNAVEGYPAFLVSNLSTSTEIDTSLINYSDTDSFVILNNKVLLNGKELVGADTKTFQVIPHDFGKFLRTDYSKDKLKVFYKGVAIYGADPSSFIGTLSDRGTYMGYARDKNHVYYEGEIIQTANPSTFVSLYFTPYEGPQGQPYGKDNRHVYYATTTVLRADVSTFDSLDWCAFADKNYVFNGEQVMPNVDPKAYKCPVYEYACLAGGTKILMLGGSYKNIENIIVGDMVMSLNIDTKKQIPSQVVQTIKRKDPIVIINNILKAAPDEPLYLSDGSIKEAQNIKIGDLLINEEALPVKVFAIEENKQVVDTYDLLLDNNKNFFAEGFLVRTPELTKILKR